MKHSKKKAMLRLYLQYFAEGSGGAGGSSGGASTGGVTGDAGLSNSGVETTAVDSDNATDAELQTGGDDGGETSAPDREAEFEAFIAEHSDLFNARVKAKVEEILPGRTRNLTKKARSLEAVMPLVDTLTARYGTPPGDMEALIQAVTQDKSTLSLRAEELGVPEDMVEELERYRTREATERRRAQESEAEERYSQWVAEAASVKEMYPDFNLRAEMKNPLLCELMEKVGVQGAYVAIHHADIQKAAVRYTAREAARRAEDNAVNRVRANGTRPQESGARQRSASTTKINPANLSKEQVEDILRRADRGEKIAF